MAEEDTSLMASTAAAALLDDNKGWRTGEAPANPNRSVGASGAADEESGTTTSCGMMMTRLSTSRELPSNSMKYTHLISDRAGWGCRKSITAQIDSGAALALVAEEDTSLMASTAAAALLDDNKGWRTGEAPLTNRSVS